MAVLWRAALSGNIGDDMTLGFLNSQLEVILKHFMTYFPYGSDSLGRREQKERQRNDSDFAATQGTTQGTATRKSAKRKQQADTKPRALASWTDHVVDHVLNLLGRDNPAKRQKLTVMPEAMTTTTTDFRADQLEALLPSIWGLLNSLPSDAQIALLTAFLEYYSRLGAQSASKLVALGFIARMYLIQLEPEYNGNFNIRHNAIVTEKIRLWLLTLPKFLWEMRANNLETTSSILDILCSVAKHGGERIFGAQLFASLQMSLVPYFFVSLPTKGDVFGPFVSLPPEQQRQVIEFLYYASNIPEKLLSAINRCREVDTLPSETQAYFQETLHL
ncbi:rRNA processing protein [Umbelopsis nana]